MIRRFAGIALGREPGPEETTVCRFRHLLEAHDLGRRLFDEVQRHLAEKGLKMATGTIVDATIISAPPQKPRRPPHPPAKPRSPVASRSPACANVDPDIPHRPLIHTILKLKLVSPIA